MQIHNRTASLGTSYHPTLQSTEKGQNNKGENEKKTIDGTKVNAIQDPNKQSNAMKSLTKQMQKLQESIEQIKGNDKLTQKEKSDQIQEIEKQIQDLQKQMLDTEQKEKEEKIKEQQDKKAEEEASRLSDEEKEKKAQEMEQESLASFAAASEHLKAAVPLYYKVKECMTQGELGTGPKYGGNLSAEAVEGLYAEASKYGRLMTKELGKAEHLAASATKASKAAEEYKKHKKAEPSDEEKENDDVSKVGQEDLDQENLIQKTNDKDEQDGRDKDDVKDGLKNKTIQIEA